MSVWIDVEEESKNVGSVHYIHIAVCMSYFREANDFPSELSIQYILGSSLPMQHIFNEPFGSREENSPGDTEPRFA